MITEPDDPATDPISEPMSMEEFAALKTGHAGGHNKSEQRKFMETMEPGTAAILSHDGLVHKENGCSFSMVLASLRNQGHPHLYKTRHLPDGRVAVACYAIGEVRV